LPLIGIVLIGLPLVVVLYALIAVINHGEHYAPQAYYRRKRGGAPVAYGYESLAPRLRRRGPEELREGPEAPPMPPPRASRGARRPSA
jgi:hypothetical protein